MHDSGTGGGGKSDGRFGGKNNSKKRKGVGDSKKGGEETVRYLERDNDAEGLGIGRTAVIVSGKSKLKLEEPAASNTDESKDANMDNVDAEEEEETAQLLLTGGTIFYTELEVSSQRNGSLLFQNLVRKLRPLCKSFAELLHHVKGIVDLLCRYLLDDSGGGGYVVNVATNDVLHMIGVLARELRQEIYPFVNTKILPRIIDDMLNPPPSMVSTNDANQKQNQPIPLDVSHVESAFRCLSYLFKYNADQIVYNQSAKSDGKEGGSSGKLKVGDADILRQYYGKTICHKRDVVRRLACESYAPLLRKCVDKGLKRHLMRTVKALAGSLANAVSVEKGDDGEDVKQTMTNSMRRARSDAIDGVSSLLFEIARGAPGRVHSKKGRLVVRSLMDCLISYCSDDSSTSVTADVNRADAVYEVASQFLFKLRGHVVRGSGNDSVGAASAFVDVLDEMHRALNTATSMVKEVSTPSTVNTSVLGHIVHLVAETINFQDGRLVQDRDGNRSEGEASRIANSLQVLLKSDVYSNAGKDLQHQILQYLCSAWRANPSHPAFVLRLGKFFPSVVSPVTVDKDSRTYDLEPALYLAQHLLPYLPKNVASTSLIPALLNAAAVPIQHNSNTDSSLVLLHTISTTIWSSDGTHNVSQVDADDSAADSFFTMEAAEQIPVILPKVRSSLADICLMDELSKLTAAEKKPTKKEPNASHLERLARVGFASRCIPFLVCLECGGDSGGDSEDEDSNEGNQHSYLLLNKVFKWYASVIKNLDSVMQSGKLELEEQRDVYIVQSLVLESFSKSATECHQRVSSSMVTSNVKNTLARATSYASNLLFSQPKSLWVVKGVAALLKSLHAIEPGSKLNDQSNETFELLVPNLAAANHFLRLYTLDILESYPDRPFITDHADIDLTDDLEEEPSYKPSVDTEEDELNPDGTVSSSLSGSCDLISLLRNLESIPVAFANERRITSQLDRVEVYARTGKLPILYAEATACHMLGLLHVKFAPVWPAAVKVIVSLSAAQEGPTWPCIEAALKKSMEKPLPKVEDSARHSSQSSSKHIKAMTNHHHECVAWEASRGKNHDVFGPSNNEKNGQVSRHVESDKLTQFESIWSIMTNAPLLTSTKSKVVVPIYFEYIAQQYYVFHSDDPDAREINLSQFVNAR